MKTLIHNIKVFFNYKQHTKALTDCNYGNNYYGDQYCQPKV